MNTNCDNNPKGYGEMEMPGMQPFTPEIRRSPEDEARIRDEVILILDIEEVERRKRDNGYLDS